MLATLTGPDRGPRRATNAAHDHARPVAYDHTTITATPPGWVCCRARPLKVGTSILEGNYSQGPMSLCWHRRRTRFAYEACVILVRACG